MTHRLIRHPAHYRKTMIVAVAVLVLCGLIGIALDWRDLHVRKNDLQNAADAAAAAGARRLDDGVAGLQAALASALQNAAGRDGEILVRFGTTPDGPWSELATAVRDPAAMRFIRVDIVARGRAWRPAWLFPQFNVAPVSSSAAATAVAAAGEAAPNATDTGPQGRQ
ncbi:MAG: pilus assembly protein TadG-related protein [Bacteroidota bacterium]